MAENDKPQDAPEVVPWEHMLLDDRVPEPPEGGYEAIYRGEPAVEQVDGENTTFAKLFAYGKDDDEVYLLDLEAEKVEWVKMDMKRAYVDNVSPWLQALLALGVPEPPGGDLLDVTAEDLSRGFVGPDEGIPNAIRLLNAYVDGRAYVLDLGVEDAKWDDLDEMMLHEPDAPWLLTLTDAGIEAPPWGVLRMVDSHEGNVSRRFLTARTPTGPYYMDLTKSERSWIPGSPEKTTVAQLVPKKQRDAYEEMGLELAPGGDYSNILPYEDGAETIYARTVHGLFQCQVNAAPLLWELGTTTPEGLPLADNDGEYSVRIQRIRQAQREGKAL